MTKVESTRVEISPDQTQTWIHFKDFSYSDFGRSETLQYSRVVKLIETDLATNRGFVDLRNIVNDDYGEFILGAHYRFQPALWRVRRGTGFPYQVHSELTDMGQSSVTFQSRLINKLDQKELVSVMVKSVYAHRSTNRSARFPDWMLRKYKPILRKVKKLTLPKSAPQIPKSAYSYDVTVAESDTDNNKHTNFSTYVRFCSDATHAAVKEGKLPRLEPDVCDFPLMELQTVYAGESRMGDKLQVLLWQQEDCRDIIRYVIRKEEESLIFHGHMLFGQSSALLSHL